MKIMKPFTRETLCYPNNIKLIAILVAVVYLSSGENLLLVLGDAILAGLVAYGLLFYFVETIKLLGTPGSLKIKLGKVMRLPILHTEPLALFIASVPSFYYSYRNADPDAGSRIALMGMLLCYFFIIFELSNLFLNVIKYWNMDRLYRDPIKTGGLGEKIYPLVADHIVEASFFLSIPPAVLTFTGIFIREQSLRLNSLKKYPDIVVLMLVIVPLSLWLLLRLMRHFKPPLSVNFARLVVLSLKDLFRSAQVKNPTQFLEALEKKKDMFEVWQKIHRFPSRIHREMAVNYLYLKNYDLAVHHFKEYLKGFKPAKLKLDRQLEMVPFLATGVNKVLFNKYRGFFINNIQVLEENFGHLEYLRPLKALENVEKAKKETNIPELYFVYSLFLNMLCEQFNPYHLLLPRKEKQRFTLELVTSKNKIQWQETIGSLLAHPEEYQRESLGDSLNMVFEISNKDYFRDAFVLKGQNNRANLLKERKNTESLQSEVKDFMKFLVPVPLHITEETIAYHDLQLYVYAMRRNQGTTVLELVHREGQIDILTKVVEYLALIHTCMPSTSFKTDFQAKVNNKFNHLRIENHLIQMIVQSMTPVVKSFEDALLVFGKDAHPGNWLVTEKGEIVALDMEDKGVVPVEIDLVNLLEFDSFGLARPEREKLKERIIREYVKYYKKYSANSVGKEPFSRLRYLNAVIQRMLCLYCFWSDSHRDPSKVKRNFVLDNALYALKELSCQFNDYFSIYRQDYNNLKTAINHLKNSRGFSN
jgi:thiamine kinase-like enzyme